MPRTPQNPWLPIVCTLLAWIAAPCVLDAVLEHNLAAGVYPPLSDSISIPFTIAVFVCIGGLPYLAVIFTLAVWRYHAPVSLFAFRWDRWNVIGVALLLPICLVTMLELASWLVPHHYLAAGAYVLPLVGFVYLRAMIASSAPAT